MEILEKYPELKTRLESLYEDRSHEILSQLLKNDDAYIKLCDERANASMALKNSIVGTESDALLEKYSDAIYELEIYEQNILYRQAIRDVLNILDEIGLLSGK